MGFFNKKKEIPQGNSNPQAVQGIATPIDIGNALPQQEVNESIVAQAAIAPVADAPELYDDSSEGAYEENQVPEIPEGNIDEQIKVLNERKLRLEEEKSVKIEAERRRLEEERLKQVMNSNPQTNPALVQQGIVYINDSECLRLILQKVDKIERFLARL